MLQHLRVKRSERELCRSEIRRIAWNGSRWKQVSGDVSIDDDDDDALE